MATRNDAEGQFVNGSIGVVEEFQPSGAIAVKLDCGWTAQIKPYTWKAGEEGNEGVWIQYPLRLAYAMTIHKSQGITLDKAYIDIRAAREPGQAYVALSRVRTLAGLQLKEWFRGLYVSNEALNFHRNLDAIYARLRTPASDPITGPVNVPGPVHEGNEAPAVAIRGETEGELCLPGMG
jgi:ATP-dependent exoDNAse (exonuclease V) alpha subunit